MNNGPERGCAVPVSYTLIGDILTFPFVHNAGPTCGDVIYDTQDITSDASFGLLTIRSQKPPRGFNCFSPSNTSTTPQTLDRSNSQLASVDMEFDVALEGA